jgi:cold-inducible RNA-binding protein
VGNLSFRTTKEELTELLSTVAVVREAITPLDRTSGKPRGFAFVEFGSDEEAAQAVSRFNGHELGGRVLKVTLATDRPQQSRPPRSFGAPAVEAGPSFFAVEGRFSRPKGSRRRTRGRKRSL